MTKNLYVTATWPQGPSVTTVFTGFKNDQQINDFKTSPSLWQQFGGLDMSHINMSVMENEIPSNAVYVQMIKNVMKVQQFSNNMWSDVPSSSLPEEFTYYVSKYMIQPNMA